MTKTPSTLAPVALEDLAAVTGGCKRCCSPRKCPQPQPAAPASSGPSVSTDVSVSYQ